MTAINDFSSIQLSTKNPNNKSIFKKRINFKPFEYPEISKFKDAINHSYWLVSEWNFMGDKHDFATKLNEPEKSAIKNALLAISQIEVSVKKFWAKIGERFPKAEFEQVGITFAESEVRHADAYSHLLQILNLNQDFENLIENNTIKGRIDYLNDFMKNSVSLSNKDYVLTLSLFALLIENVSLFSQFLIIKSFNKYKNILKDIDNVIQATIKEENLHAMFGSALINYIKEENPNWFDQEFYNKIYNFARKAYVAESAIIDWIFENGDLDSVDRYSVKEFIKYRINKSLSTIGGDSIFAVDDITLEKFSWFEEEENAQINTDFFYKKPVTYSKRMHSITAEDIF